MKTKEEIQKEAIEWEEKCRTKMNYDITPLSGYIAGVESRQKEIEESIEVVNELFNILRMCAPSSIFKSITTPYRKAQTLLQKYKI